MDETIGNWIHGDCVCQFLTTLGWIVEYDFTSMDWEVIAHGVLHSDSEKDQWYSYEFHGKHTAKFSLARDSNGGIVDVRISVPAEFAPMVKLSLNIFSHFHLAGPLKS